MHVHVLLFGALKDLRAREKETVELPEQATVGEFLRGFFAVAPQLEKYAGSLAIAVNQEYALPTQVLREGDEIALLPPVSGGFPERRVGYGTRMDSPAARADRCGSAGCRGEGG